MSDVRTTNVTIPQIVDILSEIRGMEPATVVVATAPSNLRKNPVTGYEGYGVCPYWNAGLVKVARHNVNLNFHYDRRVQREAERAGLDPNDYVRGEVWHEVETRENGTLLPFTRHPKTEERYLYCDYRSRLDATYYDKTGAMVSEETLAPWLKQREASDRQPAGEDRPVFPFTIKLANVRGVTLQGVHYVIQ